MAAIMGKKLPNYIIQNLEKLKALIDDNVTELKDKDLTQYVKRSYLLSAKGNSCWEFNYNSKIKSELRIKFIRNCDYFLNDSEMWMLCNIKNYDDSIEDDYDFRHWHYSDHFWINIRNSKEFTRHYKYLITAKYII